jgi:chromate transporter
VEREEHQATKSGPQNVTKNLLEAKQFSRAYWRPPNLVAAHDSLRPLVATALPTPTVSQIFLAALRLGCTSFGGPVAHLAFFRRDYVERRGWISERDYADIVALCQFLPGPASSQTGFGLGYQWRGWAGGLAAWAGFTLPSAALMTALALNTDRLTAWLGSGWLHGLKLAAVAIVAHAVIAMWRAHAPDAPRSALVVLAAAALGFAPFAWLPPLVIALGAGITWRWLPGAQNTAATGERSVGAAAWRRAGGLLALVVALLVVLPAIHRATGHPGLELADRCYRAGALVFGGGHVVLPLLEREFVGPGAVSADQFLAGYGAAQAMPGPLFTFAAFLGGSTHGIAGAAWATAWIFLPGLLLVAAALPVWQAGRSSPSAQAALRGANAAVVGLLLAALIGPVAGAALHGGPDVAVAAGAWAVVQFTRCQAWIVVLACAVLGGLLG